MLKEKNMYNIYGIYNKVNGKLYIGITNNLKRRWYEHKKNSKKITRKSYSIHHAMHKYGIDNFIFKSIEQADDLHHANEKEIEWVKLLKDYGYHLYNQTNGGDGVKGCSRSWTDEQKQKASERYLGKGNPMFGIHLYGSDNGNYGKSMKQHVKNALINSRRKLSDDDIKEIRYLFSQKQYSQTQLSKKFNISLTQIHRIVHNKSWSDRPNKKIIKKNMTIEDAKKIKELYASGAYTYKQIASSYNCSISHVYKIIKGLKWKMLN